MLRHERPNRSTATCVHRWDLPSLRQEVPMQVYLGIDWSEQKHDALFMDEDGRPLV